MSEKTPKIKPRERILVAGRRLFFSQGFAKVSTDMLAKEASVSKNTMYKYFGDMAGVLRAVVEAEAIRFEAGLDLEPKTRGELEETLTTYGEKLLHFLNDPEIIQFGQLMHEEARKHPDIADLFFNSAYMKTHQTLTTLLEHGLNKNLIRSELTASELAEMLINIWEGIRYLRGSLGLVEKPFDNPRDWSTKCVKKILA